MTDCTPALHAGHLRGGGSRSAQAAQHTRCWQGRNTTSLGLEKHTLHSALGAAALAEPAALPVPLLAPVPAGVLGGASSTSPRAASRLPPVIPRACKGTERKGGRLAQHSRGEYEQRPAQQRDVQQTSMRMSLATHASQARPPVTCWRVRTSSRSCCRCSSGRFVAQAEGKRSTL